MTAVYLATKLAPQEATLRDILRTLTPDSGADLSSPGGNHYATAANVPRATAHPPYIRPNTPHYRYALRIVAGMPHADACASIGVNPRTAERWRTELCKVAAEFFERSVEYHFAANYATNKEVQAMYAEINGGGRKRIEGTVGLPRE